ncbi:RelA/SpoT domain-containing protein [Acinetobacter junii]|uniref:RelA/SpoT domain-containing protein n=1 Tax=Acinetobacter junii TaxID=40215 RepID=UPI003AA7DF29
MHLSDHEKEFLENARVKDVDFEKANIDINLLIDIAEDYKKFSSDFLQEAEYIAKKLQRCEFVHSVRWRVKDVNHLIEKIVRKRCENKVAKKYQEISIDNYKSVLTDLIGVRAIHLFKDEWYGVHRHILSYWKPVENVAVYFRDGDNIDMFKGHSCKTIKHKAGYRSIHYIIPVNQIDGNKIACEIQTRTLFEEGWSEIDHRVRYPNFLDDENLKKYLDIFNRLAGSADEMGSYVNALVGLININNDHSAKITQLENKIDKLLEENAKSEEVKKAFNELKHAYDEKDKLLSSKGLDSRVRYSLPSHMKQIIINKINEENIDINSLKLGSVGASHTALFDQNNNRITIPTKYLEDLENFLNIKIR